MTTLTALQAVDTTNCDHEPIHIPGSVQPHGVLLACSADDWIITHASANAADVFRKKPDRLIGADLRDIVGAATIAALERGQRTSRAGHPPLGRLLGLRLKGRRGHYDASLHTYRDHRIFEIEPAADEPAIPPLDLVGSILARLQDSRTLVELCSSMSRELRELIGFDRVLVYRFLNDGTGQVIAESRGDVLESLLGLRYPASDIPKPARDLYKRNWIRLIADVHTAPSVIVPAPDAQSVELDLSFSDLRSVSPIHVQYLKNMAVGASMSISIIVGQELWGLIACHHHVPRRVPANSRAAAELLGQVFSLQIQTVEGLEAYVTMRAARALLDRVVAEFPADGELIDNISARLEQIAAFVQCDGAGVWMDGMWRHWRSAPEPHEAEALARFVDGRSERNVMATNVLTEHYPPARHWKCQSKGLLAIPLSNSNCDWLFFFRREITQVVEWAGNPNKSPDAKIPGGNLSPRSSFAAWREEVKGQSLPWTSRERLIGETLRVYLLDIVVRFSEVILEERRQAEQRSRLQSNQLNHRVKVTLELIQSLVHHGFEAEHRVRDFVRTLEGRIKAIALAHDAISTSGGCELRHLIESTIAMQAPAYGRVHIAGPETRLDPKAYTVLALVVHELVANSAKCGALSRPDSRLDVRWSRNAPIDDSLVIDWDESSARPVPSQFHDGLGMLIIKRNIPHTLGGDAKVELKADGFRAIFTIPARHLELPAVPLPVQQSRQRLLAQPSSQLSCCTVLIVDDHVPAALDLQRMLQNHGAAAVEVEGTVTAALERIAHSPPDVAVLDIDLGEETSIEIADELARRDIPFIFAGSRGDAAMLPHVHQDVPVVAKPYVDDDVTQLLKDALLPYLIRTVLTKLV